MREQLLQQKISDHESSNVDSDNVDSSDSVGSAADSIIYCNADEVESGQSSAESQDEDLASGNDANLD